MILRISLFLLILISTNSYTQEYKYVSFRYENNEHNKEYFDQSNSGLFSDFILSELSENVNSCNFHGVSEWILDTLRNPYAYFGYVLDTVHRQSEFIDIPLANKYGEDSIDIKGNPVYPDTSWYEYYQIKKADYVILSFEFQKDKRTKLSISYFKKVSGHDINLTYFDNAVPNFMNEQLIEDLFNNMDASAVVKDVNGLTFSNLSRYPSFYPYIDRNYKITLFPIDSLSSNSNFTKTLKELYDNNTLDFFPYQAFPFSYSKYNRSNIHRNKFLFSKRIKPESENFKLFQKCYSVSDRNRGRAVRPRSDSDILGILVFQYLDSNEKYICPFYDYSCYPDQFWIELTQLERLTKKYQPRLNVFKDLIDQALLSKIIIESCCSQK